ncbi:MAG: DUF1343 domain-containing protein [Acidobacteriota bacterium]|nr:DUF1343 domain-containing protein [Acidobacteriota bacterium]
MKLGIECLLAGGAARLRGARVGAVVHPASILPDLGHTADALRACPDLRLVSLFGPQHGARGEKQDNMVESDFYRDPDTGLPVHSLYGETRRPTPEMLQDVDVLLFDLQDVGTRVYTFIHTMSYCIESIAQSKKKLIVLDRPNPIGGDQVEGNLLDVAYRSFVGLHPVPMRHGLTIGEMALFINGEQNIGCDLEVIPMEGWHRRDWFDDTRLPWVTPSPNLPTLDAATVYPGAVLVEGTMLSEGRGTTRPFELVGAPYINGREYAAALNGLGLPGVRFRAASFQPTFQKWAGQVCGGVQTHVLDRRRFEPYLTGIAMIAVARKLYPNEFAWRLPPYEYEYEKLPIEILCGGRGVPDMIESMDPIDIEKVRGSWQVDVEAFWERRRPYLLYP